MPVQTSFVITCHNLGAYLGEALDSLAAQTARDFEIVVVNDGSTDGPTCALLADLPAAGVRVVHSERLGLPAARNLGVAHSSGALLCMVDADDLLEPTYLERSLAALLPPDVSFASHWLRAFGEEQWDWTPTVCTFPTLLHTNTLNGAALMRRTMFERLGGFDETMRDGCEDWEFWIRAVAAGYRGVIIPEFLFRYRRRADSMSRMMHETPGMAALSRQIVDRHPDVFANHLLDLLAHRDGEIASLSAAWWRLEEAWAADLDGRLQWLRDNRRTQGHPHTAAPDVARLSADLQGARAEAHRLHADFNRERQRNEELRASWSWRLTWPLRALAGRARR